MLKITKFGMLCNMVSDIALFLAMAERHSDTHEKAMNHPYYFRALGLSDNLRGLGINCEFLSSYFTDRKYFVGVAIKDNTKGAPAFAPCAYYICVKAELDNAYSHYTALCEFHGYDTNAITKEIHKIYGCK